MIEAAEELGESTGVAKACQVLGVPRSSLYQARQPKHPPPEGISMVIFSLVLAI